MAAVQLPVTIGERTLNLVFKFGTIRLAEQELGRPISAEMASGNAGLDLISALFWAVLQPSLKITREGSDDLVDEAGFEQVAAWIGTGISRYFGGGDEPAEAGNAKPAKKPK